MLLLLTNTHILSTVIDSSIVSNKNNDISWHDFRKKYMEFGGDGIYSAWALIYDEPAVKRLGIASRCNNADILQPKLMQFTTNQGSEIEMDKQAAILKKTINFFNSTHGSK